MVGGQGRGRLIDDSFKRFRVIVPGPVSRAKIGRTPDIQMGGTIAGQSKFAGADRR